MKKFSFEFVKQFIEREGYILISDEYITTHSKLELLCPKGHNIKMSFDNFKSGQRCSKCYGNKKKTIEEVKKYIEKFGYKLLSSQYISSREKMNLQCPVGHHIFMTWDSFKYGYRCPKCGGTQKLTLQEVKEFIESRGYILLSKTYRDAHSKLKLICPEGHRIQKSWAEIQPGTRCGICYRLNNFGPNAPNWRGGLSYQQYCSIWSDIEFKEYIKERDGYKCLNPYCSSKDPSDLTGHHINYDKKNCEESNIITICKSCNSSANFNREWHLAWYQAIMFRRYGFYV